MRFLKRLLLYTLLAILVGGFGGQAGLVNVSAEPGLTDQRLVILETFMRPG